MSLDSDAEPSLNSSSKVNMGCFNYFCDNMNQLKTFLELLMSCADKNNIYVGNPNSISMFSDWMADGVIVKWSPNYSNGEKTYWIDLVFMYINTALECTRCELYEKSNNNDKCVRTILQTTPQNNPETVLKIFSIRKSLDTHLQNNVKENVQND
jgi:hypothetical protein